MPVSESTATPSSLSCSLELDPLLRGLVEKKLSLKRNVTAMATELKDASNRLASHELLLAQELEARKVAELKAGNLEDEMSKLQKCLEDKDEQLRASLCSTEQFRNELDGLRSQLSVTTTLLHCSYLLGKLNDKKNLMSEGEFPANNVAEQLNHLDKRFDNDDGGAKLREDIRVLSARWENRSKELESRLDKHRRTVQELKKRVMRLELCILEPRSRLRKLHRLREKRDRALTLKEVRNETAVEQPTCSGSGDKHNPWESSAFKLIASVSMLVLFALAKR